MESERYTQFGEGRINGPSNRGRVWLTVKFNELLWPSMTFEVILIEIKYLRIHNIGIHINFYQNRFINESVRKIFLKFSKRQTERRKDGKTERLSFFVRCKRTYVLNNICFLTCICKYYHYYWKGACHICTLYSYLVTP